MRLFKKPQYFKRYLSSIKIKFNFLIRQNVKQKLTLLLSTHKKFHLNVKFHVPFWFIAYIHFLFKHKKLYEEEKTKSVSQRKKTFILSHYLSFSQTVFTSSYIFVLQYHKVYYKPKVHVRVMGITSIFISFISKSIRTAQSRYTTFRYSVVMYTKDLILYSTRRITSFRTRGKGILVFIYVIR